MASTKDIYTIDPDFYRSYTQEERERQNSQTIVRLFIWTVALVAIMFLVYTWMNNKNTIDSTPITRFKPTSVSRNIVHENILPEQIILSKRKAIVEEKKITVIQNEILERKPVVVQENGRKVEPKSVVIMEKNIELKRENPIVSQVQKSMSDELSMEYIEAVRKALGE